MTGFLTRLLGRLPVGFLQLTHSPARFAAALAGVAFANVLVFVQLGLTGAMYESVATPYRLFEPDLLLISPYDSETLADTATIPRQRIYQALVHPDITSGTPVFLGTASWLSGEGSSSAIQFVGLDTQATAFVAPHLRAPLVSLSLEDTALVDLRTRFVNMQSFEQARPDAPLTFEIGNRQLGAIGTTSIGGGFGGDGVFILSDQTFFRLFPRRSSATPSHILLKLRTGADAGRVAAELTQLLPPGTVRIRPIRQAMEEEQRYQMTERPTGLIFAFGVGIGVIVGIVIAYQVLNSDVTDHIREYATFKAMGHRNAFFVGIVMEEAIILAAIGFWPGLILSELFYVSLAHLTNIPIFMTTERAVAVFFGTIAACGVSGVLAMRKLAAADPADLF
ncbi:MAG: ABC transporter permease [Rhodomicrobium sp.]|nr:ABC transporter permease [Rhodomicrobium sp.]